VALKFSDFIPPVIVKAARRSAGVIQAIYTRCRFKVTRDDYNAEQYWRERHVRHGYNSLRGVGNACLGEDENHAWYTSARLIFEGVLNDLALGPGIRAMELGYGTGFYTRILYERGVRDCLALDIVDQHLPYVKKDMPEYYFQKCDIGSEAVDHPGCQLIYMIDVSQHIVNDDKLRFCLLHNVGQNLAPGGVFIVTDELKNQRYSFYEKSRTMDFYKKILGYETAYEPVQFRDKYLFAFRKGGKD